MSDIKTMKVRPWGENQGDHVIINVSDFNPEKHVMFDEDIREGKEVEMKGITLVEGKRSKKKTKRKTKR